MKQLFTVVAIILALAQAAWADTITRPAKSFGGTSFINGVVPQASDFNGDIDTLYSEFNGNISNANVKSAAAISGSKINPVFTAVTEVLMTAPCLGMDESDQGGDLRKWRLCVSGGQFQLGTYTDAQVLQNNWFTITRANGGFTLGGTSGSNTINGATTFNQAVTFIGSTSIVPTGAVQMYMGTSAPSGWLLMDGQSNSCTGSSSVNASLCAQLVGLFGTANYKGTAASTITVDAATDEILHSSHGKSIGDRVHFTSTTTLPGGLSATVVYCITATTTNRFKISTTCGGSDVNITDSGSGTHSDYFNFVTPDTRGRNVLGTGTGSGLTARTLGATGGTETHTLTGPESGVAAHSHGVTDPGHSHTERATRPGAGGSATNGGIAFRDDCSSTADCSHNQNSATDSTATSTTGISTNTTGPITAASAHTIMDPFLVMTFIIKL